MNPRSKGYFRYPVTKRFEDHMIEETNLSEREKQMVRDLRKNIGKGDLFAQMANMEPKQYSAEIGRVCTRLMDELFRLAKLGLEYEDSMKQ